MHAPLKSVSAQSASGTFDESEPFSKAVKISAQRVPLLHIFAHPSKSICASIEINGLKRVRSFSRLTYMYYPGMTTKNLHYRAEIALWNSRTATLRPLRFKDTQVTTRVSPAEVRWYRWPRQLICRRNIATMESYKARKGTNGANMVQAQA